MVIVDPPVRADLDDPFAPEPAAATGALVGDARVCTAGQLLDRQTRALTDTGCLRVLADKRSGKNADRPELTACLDYLRTGDVLVVPSLDRLSRSPQDLITLVGELRRRGIGLRPLHEGLDAARARGQRLGRPPRCRPSRSATPAFCCASPRTPSAPSPGCSVSAAPRSAPASPNSPAAVPPHQPQPAAVP
ncbi:recombinase family protein [Frankia sp. R82]|uniref:recombinase family protein n=1 Tax=Frankia sp. R82 TaxID=2950553 RepID=UPI002043FA24|nr:recombinase family protein [Frankia sp. R82]MCM3883334.1 recombinase family protein [Frankia sp. R82]